MTVLLALIMAVSSLPAAVMGEPVTVIATSYSCADHPDNRMFPCQQTRWGYDPLQPGAACPTTWAHTAIYVPKRGVMTCDDSGAYDALYGLPHLDIRVGSYDEAIAFGIREMVVYRVVLPRWGQERKLSDG